MALLRMRPEVTLREAHRADLPAIWQVRLSVRENTLAPGRISDADLLDALESAGRGWVAERSGRVLGFAIGLRDGRLWALFVRPEAAGRGIGSALHDEALCWFAGLPLTRLWLSTGARTRARAFYAARGWVYSGQLDDDEVRLERLNAI